MVTAKIARIRASHVEPLHHPADRIADAVGPPRDHLLSIDPDQDGIDARVFRHTAVTAAAAVHLVRTPLLVCAGTAVAVVPVSAL